MNVWFSSWQAMLYDLNRGFTRSVLVFFVIYERQLIYKNDFTICLIRKWRIMHLNSKPKPIEAILSQIYMFKEMKFQNNF